MSVIVMKNYCNIQIIVSSLHLWIVIFSTSVITHDKGNFSKEELILAYVSREIDMHYGQRLWQETAKMAAKADVKSLQLKA